MCWGPTTRGLRQIIGKLYELPPSEGTNLVWTPVEIWVPSEVIRANQAVQLEGSATSNNTCRWASRAIRPMRGTPCALRNHRGTPELSPRLKR